ncbi:MAG: TlpA family protein disulfide reductase [Hyphomicrobium sp.]
MNDKSEANGSAPNGSGSIGKSLGILALFALIGFGAVYVTLGRPDNAAIQEKAADKVGDGGETGNADAKDAPGDKMAAFVRKKTPEALPEITFNDADGKTLTLADFKGKTILLNLWATWCAPCREEMPALDRLQSTLGGDDFEVIALSLDRKGAAASKKFLDETKATHLKLYTDASGKQGTVLKIVGMPTTILINKEGQEIGRLAGPAEWDSPDAKKLIEAALK